MRWTALGCLLLLAGCGTLRSHLGDDGGLPRNDSGNPAGGDGGSPDGGSPDAGSPFDGGPVWSLMSAPAAVSYFSVGGVGSGANVVLYAGTDVGRINRYAQGQWSNAYTDPNPSQVNGLWVSPSEMVFGAQDAQLLSCTANCSLGGSYVRQAVPEQMNAVCGLDASHVYAVGTATQTGVLYQWTGSTWMELSSNLGVSYANGCWLAANGDVYVAAESAIGVYSGGAFQQESINWPSSWNSSDIGGMYFYAVGGAGTAQFAVGSNQRIFEKANGTWSLAFDGQSTPFLYAVAFGGPGNGIAAGFSDTTTPSVVLLSTVVGSTTAPTPEPSAPPINARAAWAAGPHEFYVAGDVPHVLQAAVYSGTW